MSLRAFACGACCFTLSDDMTADNAPSLVDIGANLANRAFVSDLDAVLERAVRAGVGRIVVTGTNVETSADARRLAQRWPELLRATAGMHPHHAKLFDAAASTALRDLISRDVVAIGECGLDFDRNFSTRTEQERCFEAQLELAAEVGLPLFLHERDAHDVFAEIVRRHRSRFSRAVVHCFTGGKDELVRYLDLDLYIGITGYICDQRRGQHLKDLVRLVPADRLMIETDAPYLLPRDLPKPPANRRNEPSFLPHVLQTIAACRNEPPEHVARATTATAARFFGWASLVAMVMLVAACGGRSAPKSPVASPSATATDSASPPTTPPTLPPPEPPPSPSSTTPLPMEPPLAPPPSPQESPLPTRPPWAPPPNSPPAPIEPPSSIPIFPQPASPL